MPLAICPRCQQRYMYDSSCVDFVHNCGEQGAASEVLKNEDVMVMGSWEDYTGSEIKGQQEVLMQGAENKIFGQRGWIEGEKPSSYTSRGNDTDLFRTRKHSEFIKLKGGE